MTIHSRHAVCAGVAVGLLAFAGTPAHVQANSLQLAFIQFVTPYTPTDPTDTSTGARINFATLDKRFVDTVGSNATIRRGAQRIVVPVSSVTDSQPGAKPGLIQFAKVGTSFMPGDMVTFTILFVPPAEPPAKVITFETTGGAWTVGASANGNIKIKSTRAVYDPTYTVFNALDLGVFSGTASFSIRNLGFLGNLTPEEFGLLDIESILAGSLPPGIIPVPEFELQSSLDTSLSTRVFTDPFPEPGPGRFDVAFGQFFDPDTGTLSAFIDGYRAVPGPLPLVLLLEGSLIVGLARWRRRPRRGQLRQAA